jgi:hypothetical protein
MKALILTTTLLATTPALAEDKPSCSDLAGLAQTIMEVRQNGVDMVKVMEVAGDTELYRQLIIMAYEQPKFDTARYKQERISEFKNMVYRECLQAE